MTKPSAQPNANPKLSAAFLESLVAKSKGNAKGKSLVEAMVQLTEKVRQEILLPGSERIKAGQLLVESKDTGDLRGGDAKTITVETDRIVERRLTELQAQAFPGAYIIGEEMFGAADIAGKKAMLEKAMQHDALVIFNDALDGTRPFTQGKDGFGSMVSMVKNGKLVGAVVHLTRQMESPEGLGYTLTWEEGDVVRLDGVPLPRLDQRDFPADAKMLRGYAGFEFLKGTPEMSAAFAVSRPPALRNSFDGISDLWTCGTLYRDLLQGRHHFMLVPPPLDLFDYPMGIALIEKAGGVVKFVDGTPATLEEIIKRQGFGQPSFDPKNPDATAQYLSDPSHFRAPENTLIFAVNENVFRAVQGVFKREILDRRRNPEATRIALKGGNPAHAQGYSGVMEHAKDEQKDLTLQEKTFGRQDTEIAKAVSVIDLFDAGVFNYISAPLLYSPDFLPRLIRAAQAADSKDYADALIRGNLDHANDVANKSKAAGAAVIVPARFNDVSFPFSPLQRQQFLFEVINKKATAMKMVDGWEFSPPAIEELMCAILLQAGRIPGCNKEIAILDEAGARLSIPRALELVAASVTAGLQGDIPMMIESHVQDFMYLSALAMQVRRDVLIGEARGWHGSQGMTKQEAMETDVLLRKLRPLSEYLLAVHPNLHVLAAEHQDDDVAQKVAAKIIGNGDILHLEENALLADQPARAENVPGKLSDAGDRKKPPSPKS